MPKLSPNTTLEQVGARVTHARTMLALSQRALARALGVSVRAVQRWETGGRVRKVYLDRLDDMMRQHEERVRSESVINAISPVQS